MRPSGLKQAAPFLLKFALASALLLALWPPLSWVYGPLLGAAANALFSLVRPVVSIEVGDQTFLIHHLWPNVTRYAVRDFSVVYLNALVLLAVFAALPGGVRGHRKSLGVAFLALSASHLLCLYLLSHAVLSGSASQHNLLVSRPAALICDKLYALWGAFGWEGLPFLAGALAFGKAQGLFRAGRSGPSSPRMRRRRPQAEWGHPTRRREAHGVRRRVSSPRARRL
jgi:hypothetical protein